MNHQDDIDEGLENTLLRDDHPSAVQHVAALGLRGADPRVVHETRHEKRVALNGELVPEVYKTEPPARKHQADSVEALALLAGADSVAWHRGDKVTLVLDNSAESLRDDIATWELTPTEAWVAATRMMIGVGQKALVRVLSTSLRKEIEEGAPHFLEAVRLVKFDSSQHSEGEVRHAKESMGKSIKAEATGAGAIPEWVTLKVRRWAELDHVAELDLRVDVDVHEEEFTVKPTTDDLKVSELAAQKFLGDHLRSHLAESHVVAGAP